MLEPLFGILLHADVVASYFWTCQLLVRAAASRWCPHRFRSGDWGDRWTLSFSLAWILTRCIPKLWPSVSARLRHQYSGRLCHLNSDWLVLRSTKCATKTVPTPLNPRQQQQSGALTRGLGSRLDTSVVSLGSFLLHAGVKTSYSRYCRLSVSSIVSVFTLN